MRVAREALAEEVGKAAARRALSEACASRELGALSAALDAASGVGLDEADMASARQALADESAKAEARERIAAAGEDVPQLEAAIAEGEAAGLDRSTDDVLRCGWHWVRVGGQLWGSSTQSR